MCDGSPYPMITSHVLASSSTITSIKESQSLSKPVLPAATAFDPPNPLILPDPPIIPTFDPSLPTVKGGFIGRRSVHKSIIERALDTPLKPLAPRRDVIDRRFHIDESSRTEDGVPPPSTYKPARLYRRVDIATLWNNLEAEGRARYDAVWAEFWQRPRRDKNCIDPTIWDSRTIPNTNPSPEMQAIMARINYYYAQSRGPQVPLVPGNWAYYSSTYPKNVA